MNINFFTNKMSFRNIISGMIDLIYIFKLLQYGQINNLFFTVIINLYNLWHKISTDMTFFSHALKFVLILITELSN